MGWLSDLAFRLRALWHRRQMEEELEDELQFHLAMEAAELRAAGGSADESRRRARLTFGGPQAIKEECREAWGTRLIDQLGRDLRLAGRRLLAERRFATVAVSSLAIGIGAATVIFSVVDAVLLRPLPFGDPDRVVAFFERTPLEMRFSTSDPNLLNFEQRSETLSAIAAQAVFGPQPALGTGEERVRVEGLAVTPSYFRVLGVEAQRGRTFGPADLDSLAQESARAQDRVADAADDSANVHRIRVPRIAVISDGLWRRQFAGDPEIVGRTIDLDGEDWTVLGVLPPELRITGVTADIYLPYIPNPSYPRGDRRLDAVARLAPGVTLEEARSELSLIAGQLGAEYPESNADWSVELERLDEVLLGSSGRSTNLLLVAAVGLLLALACVNVSTLLLARGSDRESSIRLRLALGASRPRLLAQLLTESVLLGVFGGLGGLLLALWAVPLVRRLEVALPRMDEMRVDLRVVLFAAGVALLAGLAFGIAPALRLTAPADSLRTRMQGPDARGRRLRTALVASEVAIATVLTLTAGLLLRSFEELQKVESGFDTENVLLAQVDLPHERYPEDSDAASAFFRRLLERLQGAPGVEAASAVNVSHFRGPTPTNSVATAEETDRDHFVQVQWRSVTPDYFRTLRIPLRQGRSFDERSRFETVISAQLAARLWPTGDPLGQRLRWNQPDGPLFEVIGIVNEVQDMRPGSEPPPTVYVPQDLVGWPNMTLAVRTEGAPAALAPLLREAVGEIDPLLATPNLSTLEGQRREALALPLLSLRLVGLFALVAMTLAAVGVYGLVAYAVSRRRRELGLRVALGARPGQLVSLVVRGSLLMLSAGLAAGLLGSFALVGWLRSLLFQISPFDLGVLTTVAALLLVVGLSASWLPALRAARLDPVGTLREE